MWRRTRLGLVIRAIALQIDDLAHSFVRPVCSWCNDSIPPNENYARLHPCSCDVCLGRPYCWLEISTERSKVENCIMVCFNCILDCGYFHCGIAKSHFCFKSEIGAANGISWHLDSSRVELSTKLVFWGLIVVSSDRGGWGDHSGPLFMSIRGWGEELWTIYCWETVGEYLNPSGVGSIVKLWLFWRVCGQFGWRKVRGFILCRWDMLKFWYEVLVRIGGGERACLIIICLIHCLSAQQLQPTFEYERRSEGELL